MTLADVVDVILGGAAVLAALLLLLAGLLIRDGWRRSRG